MSYSPTIYCIGRNYRKHAEELGNDVPTEPVVFLKAANSLRGLDPEPMAFEDETFHYEAELVLKIGRKISLGSKGSWEDVSHVALGLDLTRRGVQEELKKKGLPWERAKSFKGSAIVGPFVPNTAFHHPHRINFTFELNGELKQKGDTSLMLFSFPMILTFLATMHDLEIGDLVFTGTPEGVGTTKKGDTYALCIIDIGYCAKGLI